MPMRVSKWSNEGSWMVKKKFATPGGLLLVDKLEDKEKNIASQCKKKIGEVKKQNKKYLDCLFFQFKLIYSLKICCIDLFLLLFAGSKLFTVNHTLYTIYCIIYTEHSSDVAFVCLVSIYWAKLTLPMAMSCQGFIL